MKKYDIFYENLGGEEEYLDQIIELLDGNQNISFHIGGLIIDLIPGMTKDEVINKINTTKAEYEKEEEIVKIQEDESLLTFSKRLSLMSKSRSSYFSTIYKSQKIIAAPGCTDFDILYQIMQINATILSKDGNTEEIQARFGEDYMQFGARVFEELKKGKNINGHFNYVTMPFTSDLANFNNFYSSDAFTFSSMIHNMQYVINEQYEAFRNAKENIQNNSGPQEITPVDALKSALLDGTSYEDIGRIPETDQTKDIEEQAHDRE